VDETVLPTASETPGRKLRADSIEVTLEGGHAKTVRAQGSVRIETEGNRGEADQATLALSPSGEAQTLELVGSVRMEGEGRSGRADRAVEVADRGLWILTGNSGRSATVEGDGSRISSARIEIDQKQKNLRAEGGSRALLTPRKTGDRPATPVGDSSRPIFAKADRMTFDDTTRVATFSGGATLWQDASSVFGNDITLNDHERTLVAVGNTRTVFSPARDSSAKAAADRKDSSPTVVTARRLVYRESAAPGNRETPPTAGGREPSVAAFEGGVVATSGTWRATGEKATAWIGADRKLERVEMSGNVAFSDAKEGRSGQGDKITDWPGEGRTVLEGSPAWVLDRDGNRIAGATLTIGKRGGSVEVTAPEGGRTQTIHKTRSR
jgi:lipopolysaccharide export system protein LptA